MSNATSFLLLGLGLAAGNFAYQAMVPLIDNSPPLWAVATERTFFQAFALLMAAWTIK